MKLIWGRVLGGNIFELVDWQYRWYGIELKNWGLGISLKKLVPHDQTTEERSYTPSPRTPGK